MLTAILAYIAEQVGGIDEIIQIIVIHVIDLIFITNPSHMALIDEHDILANAHHRVHVVGINDGGDAKLVGDVTQQFVNHNRSLGVKT